MKKRVLSIIMVMMFVIGVMEAVPTKAATVSLSTSKKTVYAGSFFQLKLKNADGDVEWKSSKESVAQVLPSGIVVALKKGKATITATYKGVSYGCTVTVKSPSVNKTKATMRVDDTLRLKMKGNNAVSWSSSNEKVATVDDGGLVKALMVGTTTVTAKCEDGNEYTSKITVKNYNVKVGDTIKMGHYEQDNNTYNGDELIEWDVLDVKDGKALLITKDAIACYSIGDERSVWEDSKIRKWLNQDFYDTAFSKEEKTNIAQTVVTADLNPEYNTRQGTATLDYLFILSIKEYLEYEPDSRQSSEVLMSHGHSDHTSFWFRTAGGSEKKFTCKENDAINYYGKAYGDDWVNYDKALWICMWITIE